MMLSGGIWGLSGAVVHGWLSGAGDEAVTIEIFAGDRPLAQGVLGSGEGGRPLPGDARGFAVPIAGDLAAVTTISAFANGVLFARLRLTDQGYAFAGAIEVVGAKRIEGWAVDLKRLDQPVTLDALFAGLWVGAVRTDIARPDIAARFGSLSECGFAYDVPIYLRGDVGGVFRLLVANTSIEMMGSPISRSRFIPITKFDWGGRLAEPPE